MKKRTVIRNVPTRLPVNGTILHLFLLYYFEAHPILWGVYCTLCALWWIGVIIFILNQESIDLDKNEPKINLKKSKFAKRLEELSKLKSN